jgi:NADPH:quinone reductase-like Zn-dependent oxidoreductase
MRAVIWSKYGPPEVLILGEAEMPEPRVGEMLVRVHATSVTKGDCEMRALDFPFFLSLPMRVWTGFLKPKAGMTLGSEFAGVVERVGEGVQRFEIGDEVFGSTGMKLGTNAAYVCVAEAPDDSGGAVALKPANMSFEEAATVPFGGRDALHFIRLGELQPGQKILINGAGGSIGVFAVQLAKLEGAEVAAVDRGEKLDMLRELGADEVIDFRKEDFSKRDQTYDLIFDVVGTIRFPRANRVLKKGGTYLLANPMKQLLPGFWTNLTSGRKVKMQTASGTVEDLEHLKALIEGGKLRTVIDRTYPLEEIVAAHRYVETGAKRGNLVIKVGSSITGGTPGSFEGTDS